MATRIFRYYVTVECETEEQATDILAQRLLRIFADERYVPIAFDFHSVTDYEENA